MGDFKIGNSAIANMYYGNTRIASVYYGSKLIWPTLNLTFGDGPFIFIKYKPKNNETLNNATVFLNSGRTNGWMFVVHESGFCVAISNTESFENKTLYNCSGYTAFSTNFNSPTLYKDNVYYFGFKTSQWDNNGNTFAYYSGKTGNYKKLTPDGNYQINNIDFSKNPYIGHLTSAEEFYGKLTNNSILLWTDNDFNYGLCQSTRDNSKIRGAITDDLLNTCTTQAQKFALPYYLIGNKPGDEIVYLSYNSISWNGHNEFTDGRGYVYKSTNNITGNHITSLTPVTEEPAQRNTFDIWYKAAGITWGADTDAPYSNEGVIYWDGSKWADAASWTVEFEMSKDSKNNPYTNQNITTVLKGPGTTELTFATTTLGVDKKFYLAVNGVEY